MYSKEDLYNFARKDAVYAIGMGRGNALSKAVDLVASFKERIKVENGKGLENEIYTWAEKFYNFNQEKIADDLKIWEEFEGKALKEKLGIIEKPVTETFAFKPPKEWKCECGTVNKGGTKCGNREHYSSDEEYQKEKDFMSEFYQDNKLNK